MGKADWEAIEHEYRAGQLSIREIGRQYRVSHVGIKKHAKKAGWKQDLKEEVQQEVTKALVPTIVTTDTEVTTVTNSHIRDKEIVRAAAVRTLKLVRIHRTDAKQQREILRTLMAMLRNRVPDDKVLLDFESLRDVSTVSRNAASALKALVSIERQAYGLDVKGEGNEGGGVQEIKVNIINFGAVICAGNNPTP